MAVALQKVELLIDFIDDCLESNTKINCVTKDIILILSTQVTTNMYNKYSSLLGNNDKLYFISDNEANCNEKDNIIHYETDESMKLGYYDMHSYIKCCAWDKSVRYIFENKMTDNNWKYVWFIEDDTYIDDKFNQIIEGINDSYKDIDLLIFGWHKCYMTDNNDWDHWSKGLKYFDKEKLCSSINQFCRVSKELLSHILEFKNEHNSLAFHEVLFASIAAKYDGLSMELIKMDNIQLSAYDYMKDLNIKQKVKRMIEQDISIKHPMKKWYDVV